MGIHFYHTLGIVWISASPKIFEKSITLEGLFFPYFPRIMGIHFSHILEIVWISASPKIFKKPINLKCLCFPILFPYHGNPIALECLCFPIRFPYYVNSVLPCYRKKCFYFTQNRGVANIVGNPNLWNICVFP